MKKIDTTKCMELKLENKEKILDTEVVTFFEKKVTPFGSGAKIDCPKEYLGKKAYVVIRKD